jgi:hypothetical protein
MAVLADSMWLDEYKGLGQEELVRAACALRSEVGAALPPRGRIWSGSTS